jgi:hypothetical protein
VDEVVGETVGKIVGAAAFIEAVAKDNANPPLMKNRTRQTNIRFISLSILDLELMLHSE